MTFKMRCLALLGVLTIGGVASGAARRPAEPRSPAPVWAPVDTTVPGHPSRLPVLAEASSFPRFSPEQLAWNGYPDHQHAYFWPGWEAPRDENGVAYGFGSLCRGRVSRDRPDLQVEPGRLMLGAYQLEFNRDAAPCFVAPFLGLCEMAGREVSAVLGLDPPGRLRIVSPDRISDYTALTGLGAWRMFRLSGDAAVVQPVGILARRTLIGHAAWDLVTQWAIHATTGDALPAWLSDGIASWLGEMGVHLCNYMAMPRAAGEPILLPPARVEADLRAPADPDPETDKSRWRRARYNAFLMVWRLVERHGGPEGLRALLEGVAAGGDPDVVAQGVYGRDLATLAADLDPTRWGEPVGAAVQQRNPSRQP